MRLHVGVSMPEKGGRPGVVVAEVRRAPDVQGRRRWHFVVGHVEMVPVQTIEGARDRLEQLVLPVRDVDPCVFVDVGTPQGFALRRSLRVGWPKGLHKPHAYERTKFDNTMFANFLEVYADGRMTIRGDVGFRRELDRALVLYRSGGVGQAGDVLLSEDEALVNALCLSLMFPTHGEEAAALIPPEEPVV